QTIADDRAGDVAELRGPEDLADLRGADLDLFVLGLEHALERALDVVDRLVDDRVVADVDAFAVCQVASLRLRTDVEADDDRVVDRGQVDVVLRDRTDAAVDDPQIDLVAHIDLEQRVLERFDGTRDIALEDEVEHVDLALGQCLGEVLEADALATAGLSGAALDGVALLGDLAGRAVVIGGDERITGTRAPGRAGPPAGTARPALVDLLAVLVEHRTRPTVGGAADDGVALAQAAGLDEHGRHGAAALVELGLDRDAASGLVGVRPQ